MQLVTGFCSVLNVYPSGWFFPPVHVNFGWVLLGSVLMHVGAKLPGVRHGLQASCETQTC